MNGLRLILDGVPAEIVRSNLIKEIRFARDRHAQVANVFRSAASYAPIFGLLGTLVGVVQVLMTLTDPKSIGAAMAVAMTATFYGIFSANFTLFADRGQAECLLPGRSVSRRVDYRRRAMPAAERSAGAHDAEIAKLC